MHAARVREFCERSKASQWFAAFVFGVAAGRTARGTLATTPAISRRALAFGLALVCLMVALAWPASARTSADPDTAALESFIVESMAREAIPGVAVVLIADHQISYERGFGIADASGRPMQVDTPSALGSVSKSYTAAAIMQLVAQGRFTLDTPVSALLAEFADSGDALMQQITIRQLLSHRSGFSTYDGNFGQANYAQFDDALDRAVKRLAGVTLNADPGAQFEYSNGNYQILGLIIERMDEASYEEAIAQRVFSPLGLQSSFVRVAGSTDSKPAQGHRYWLSKPVPFDKPTPRTIVAQGGVFSSAHDVALYLLDLMAVEPKLLPALHRDALFNAVAESTGPDYGLGWFVDTDGELPFIFHGGSNPGYETLVGFVPASGSGFVALVNAGSGFAAGDVAGLLKGVQDIALGRTPAQPTPSNSNLYVAGGLVLLSVVLLVNALGWLRRLFSASRLSLQSPAQVLRFGVVVSALAALGFGLLVVLPREFTIPLPGLMAFAPDAGMLLLSAGSLAIAGAVLRCLVVLRSLSGLRRPPGDAA